MKKQNHLTLVASNDNSTAVLTGSADATSGSGAPIPATIYLNQDSLSYTAKMLAKYSVKASENHQRLKEMLRRQYELAQAGSASAQTNTAKGGNKDTGNPEISHDNGSNTNSKEEPMSEVTRGELDAKLQLTEERIGNKINEIARSVAHIQDGFARQVEAQETFWSKIEGHLESFEEKHKKEIEDIKKSTQASLQETLKDMKSTQSTTRNWAIGVAVSAVAIIMAALGVYHSQTNLIYTESARVQRDMLKSQEDQIARISNDFAKVRDDQYENSKQITLTTEQLKQSIQEVSASVNRALERIEAKDK